MKCRHRPQRTHARTLVKALRLRIARQGKAVRGEKTVVGWRVRLSKSVRDRVGGESRVCNVGLAEKGAVCRVDGQVGHCLRPCR